MRKVLVVLFVFSIIASQVVVGESGVSADHTDSLILRDICDLLAELYTDLTGEYGCVRESLEAEINVCYTSTNLLAEYVLRELCGNTVLADKVRSFLNVYSTDFYNYYQILMNKSFTLPLTVVEHEDVTTVRGIRIVHVKRTSEVFHDYDQYADLLVYSALYYLAQGNVNNAVIDLVKLNLLFNGYGFRDKAFSGIYETYKLALAVIAFKAINHTNLVEKYTSILRSIKPLATLYIYNETTGELSGIGDLNVETACLIAIALYSDIPYRIKPETRLDQINTLTVLVIILLVITLALVIVILALMLRLMKNLTHTLITRSKT